MLATLRLERPDQVPIQLGCREEVMRQLCAHYGVSDDLEMAAILGADMNRYATPAMDWSSFEARANGEHGGQPVLFHDERTFEDQWGVWQRIGCDGKYLEAASRRRRTGV